MLAKRLHSQQQSLCSKRGTRPRARRSATSLGRRALAETQHARSSQWTIRRVFQEAKRGGNSGDVVKPICRPVIGKAKRPKEAVELQQTELAWLELMRRKAWERCWKREPLLKREEPPTREEPDRLPVNITTRTIREHDKQATNKMTGPFHAHGCVNRVRSRASWDAEKEERPVEQQQGAGQALADAGTGGYETEQPGELTHVGQEKIPALAQNDGETSEGKKASEGPECSDGIAASERSRDSKVMTPSHEIASKSSLEVDVVVEPRASQSLEKSVSHEGGDVTHGTSYQAAKESQAHLLSEGPKKAEARAQEQRLRYLWSGDGKRRPEPSAISTRTLERTKNQARAAKAVATRLTIPLDDELKQFLFAAEQQRQETGKDQANKNDRVPTVLVLTSASRDLLATDFHRLAPQGRILEGWASHLLKVIRGRHPLTGEPLGQYYLIFGSRGTAMQYAETIKEMHRLSRAALPENWRKKVGEQGTPLGPRPLPQLGNGEDVPTRVRNYTLWPPSAAPAISEYAVWKLREALLLQARRLQRVSSGGGKRADFGPGSPQHYMLQLLEGKVTQRDLGCHVQLELENGFTTLKTILKAIREDGEQRNHHWRMRPALGSDVEGEVFALSHSEYGLKGDRRMGKQGDSSIIGEEDGHDANEGQGQGQKLARTYSSFVVALEHSVEAGRFVRGWHRREMEFKSLTVKKTVLINAVALEH